MEGGSRVSAGGSQHQAVAAVLSVAEGLDTMVSVQRAIDAATTLTGARYGAVGLFDRDGSVSEFIYRGITDERRAQIGPLPQGRGVLGMLARQQGPLRLADVGQHAASVGFPDHHPKMTSFLGAPIIVGSRTFGSIYLTNKAGGQPFTADDESLVMALADAVAVAVRNNLSFERTRQRERWQRAATAIDYAVLSGSAPVEVLESIAAEARRLSGADVAVVALPDEQERLVVEIVDVRNVRALGEARWSVDRSRRHEDADAAHLQAVGGWLGRLCEGDCLLASSFASGETMLAPGRQAAPAGAPAADAFTTAVCIPMRTPGRSLGVLGLLWDHEVPRLSDAGLEVAESFAAQAAVTLMLSEARREYERLMVFEDRDRIARDMHDLVVQRVFATGMSLQAALRGDDVPDAVRARVERAITDLDETISEIRRTIFDLHTTSAAPASTSVRIQRELVQATVMLGFTPSLSVEGGVDTLPSSTAENLIAALREGLSNAARHAQASAVGVSIEVGEERVRLSVDDDGVGPPARLTRQSGIANLARRAAALGGESRLERASAGGGSRLLWLVPRG
jgi:signal transduction histidine kinase